VQLRADGRTSCHRQCNDPQIANRKFPTPGDGRFVFDATLDRVLVRIDTATDQMSEIVTAPPTVYTITGGNANANPTVDLVSGSQ
jgi:hypothetical protein